MRRLKSGKTTSKLGYGRGRGRRCRAGVALRASRGGGRCRRRRHCGRGEGRQSGAGKAQTEAKTCCPHPDEVGGGQIGDQEAFSEETCGQEDVREAEAITSGIFGLRSAEQGCESLNTFRHLIYTIICRQAVRSVSGRPSGISLRHCPDCHQRNEYRPFMSCTI